MAMESTAERSFSDLVSTSRGTAPTTGWTRYAERCRMKITRIARKDWYFCLSGQDQWILADDWRQEQQE